MFSPADHTFVVCAYKESPYLQECIRSLINQTATTSIIIATSTPNNAIFDAAQKHGIEVRVNDATPGICSDWNFAVSQANTPLVTIAHQDDTYEPAYAEHALHGMNSVADPLMFFTNYGELRDGKDVDRGSTLFIKRMLLRPISHVGASNSMRIKRGILSIGSSICCPSVTLHVPALPTPPFQSTMKSNLDWDTWERFSHIDGSFVYDSEILMHHRIHEGSETSALIKNKVRGSEDLEMLERFWPTPVARCLNVLYALGQKSNG